MSYELIELSSSELELVGGGDAGATGAQSGTNVVAVAGGISGVGAITLSGNAALNANTTVSASQSLSQKQIVAAVDIRFRARH